MVGSLLVLLTLAAPVRLAAPGLQAVNLDPKLADLFLDRFVVLAKQPGLLIVTSRDISQVLGLERQKELMGCDSSGCVAELAGALGADAMLVGTVARTEQSYTLVIRAIAATDATELASATVRARSEDELQAWIEANAWKFGEQLIARVRGVPLPEHRSSSLAPWLTLGGGGVLAATGAVLRGLAEEPRSQLLTASATTRVDVAATVSKGRGLEVTGNVLLGVGAAAIATGIVLFLVEPREPVVALAPMPGGAALVFGGTF
jgi:hypothetical protein